MATKSKSAYEVVKFEMMPVCMLVPHPAALIPIDDEDKESIERSIRDHQVVHPLIISADTDRETFTHEIYDGVNRWRSAQALEMEYVPCLLVRCDNPAMIVAESLAAGRKRTTGQRILVYLEAHKDAVLEARRKGRVMQGNIQKQLKNVQQNAGVSNETPGGQDFTVDGIATLLKCSKPDVVSALELFEAMHTQTVPDNFGTGKRAHEADEAELEGLREQRNQVLSGHSPVRAWKRAYFGREATKGQTRAPIDYARLMDSSLSGMLSALPKWTGFSHGDKALFEEKFAKVLNNLPEDLKVLLK